ncbi:MAG: hypothetical protein P8J01_00790 [Acidimicrobiales bacterium]|nr:hypothetical protein [Acidimicrobiales bacterium]
MGSIEDVQRFLGLENGLATVSTAQKNGGILSSVVNCGVLPHPITQKLCVAFVSAGNAARLKHIERGSQVTIAIRREWKWVSVSSKAHLFGPEHLPENFDRKKLRILLRNVFISAGGTHDNFEEYDKVMASEKRVVVCVPVERIRGNT